MLEVNTLIIPAFIAGILTFLAPCTLPILPAYLSFISGISLEDLKNPQMAGRARFKIFINGAAFVVGFTLIFVILGTLFGFVGGAVVAQYRIWLTRIGGIFVILFGLFMLNVLKIPFLTRERQFHVPQIFERGRPVNSLILGSAFGLGWTPCVGPILGAILTLAAASATAFQGAFLLVIFSLGLAIPFLAVAAGVGSTSHFISGASKYLNIISIIGGLLLIFLGIVIATDNMALFIAYAYRLFNFINYDRLLDYL